MHETQRKEDISISYISAICAHAGISYETVRHDEDSTDGILRKFVSFEGIKYNSELHIQLKSTSSKSQYSDKGDKIVYKLKAKNFNDLCCPGTVPIILGLLILPENETDWVAWSPEELLIKGCMYWADLSSETESNNKNTVDIKIDKSNLINVETLLQMMEKIARGELL